MVNSNVAVECREENSSHTSNSLNDINTNKLMQLKSLSTNFDASASHPQRSNTPNENPLAEMQAAAHSSVNLSDVSVEPASSQSYATSAITPDRQTTLVAAEPNLNAISPVVVENRNHGENSSHISKPIMEACAGQSASTNGMNSGDNVASVEETFPPVGTSRNILEQPTAIASTSHPDLAEHTDHNASRIVRAEATAKLDKDGKTFYAIFAVDFPLEYFFLFSFIGAWRNRSLMLLMNEMI